MFAKHSNRSMRGMRSSFALQKSSSKAYWRKKFAIEKFNETKTKWRPKQAKYSKKWKKTRSTENLLVKYLSICMHRGIQACRERDVYVNASHIFASQRKRSTRSFCFTMRLTWKIEKCWSPHANIWRERERYEREAHRMHCVKNTLIITASFFFSFCKLNTKIPPKPLLLFGT